MEVSVVYCTKKINDNKTNAHLLHNKLSEQQYSENKVKTEQYLSLYIPTFIEIEKKRKTHDNEYSFFENINLKSNDNE